VECLVAFRLCQKWILRGLGLLLHNVDLRGLSLSSEWQLVVLLLGLDRKFVSMRYKHILEEGLHGFDLVAEQGGYCRSLEF
jgi:hypothetical protein